MNFYKNSFVINVFFCKLIEDIPTRPTLVLLSLVIFFRLEKLVYLSICLSSSLLQSLHHNCLPNVVKLFNLPSGASPIPSHFSHPLNGHTVTRTTIHGIVESINSFRFSHPTASIQRLYIVLLR